MAFDRLALYNGALMLAGETFLATLTEQREPRRLLDQVWDVGGVRACIEKAQWHFAMRAVRLDHDPAYARDWGYAYAFSKADDWVQTSAVCSDEFFRTPITSYQDEVGYWYADVDPIYIRYVSDDAAFGGNMSKWPASFCNFVKCYFASEILPKLAGDRAEQMRRIMGPPGQPEKGQLHITFHMAKSSAAFGQPTQYPAQGAWSSARRGNRAGNRDGGNRGSLIG